MKKIIEIDKLNKAFGDIKAVNDLSFSVREGEFFAFLGVNGAGKSTTINIMTSTLSKDSGKVVINGNNIDESSESVKRDIGVVFQNSVLDKSLSVFDNLSSRGALYSLYGDELKNRIKEMSELLDFEKLLKRGVGKLSGGQRRRVDIARALLHKPKILILDEPTTGLDPQTRSLLWRVISDLRKKENMTVFLTTHYMEEASSADYVVILDNGSICAEGTPHELKSRYAKDTLIIYEKDESRIKAVGRQYQKTHDAFTLSVESSEEAKRIITEWDFSDFEFIKGRMDDVFLAATGRKLEGGELE